MRSWIVAAVALMSLTITAAAQQPAAAAADSDGAALYKQHCRSCHGAKGVPPARMLTLYPTLKTLADSAEQAHLTEAAIVKVLQDGKGKDMKSFADKLSSAEMAAVAKYLKTFASSAPAPSGP